MSYEKGDKVLIINSTLSGKYFIEGQAEIVAPVNDDVYTVRFMDGYIAQRFVDPLAQCGCAQAVLDRLNKPEKYSPNHSLFRFTVEDVQGVAQEALGRDLDATEIDRVQEWVDDSLAWRECVETAVDNLFVE